MKSQRREGTDRADAAKLQYTLGPAPEAAALSSLWRKLEAHAESSFFQSWGWLGTWHAALPPGQTLLLFTGSRHGNVVCLALLGVRGNKRHYLSETGDPEIDQLTVEYNGMLIERGSLPLLASDFLPALLAMLPPKAGLVASGVKEDYLAAPITEAFSRQIRATKTVHAVELSALRDDGMPSLGKSTQAKIRQSLARYSRLGEIRLSEARDVKEAVAVFDRLAALHQTYWQGRGRRGAFASPFIRQFHHALIEERFGAGEIQLLRLAAGDAPIGYLYNFRYRQRIYAYQSGFDYALVAKARPGYLCHWHALRHNWKAGAEIYDFLAGTDQMKQAFANKTETLHWLRFRRKTLLYAIETGLRSTKRAASSFFARSGRG